MGLQLGKGLEAKIMFPLQLRSRGKVSHRIQSALVAGPEGVKFVVDWDQGGVRVQDQGQNWVKVRVKMKVDFWVCG